MSAPMHDPPNAAESMEAELASIRAEILGYKKAIASTLPPVAPFTEAELQEIPKVMAHGVTWEDLLSDLREKGLIHDGEDFSV